MHGQGTLRYANGDLYIGEWFQSQRSGQGTLNKANGDCYEGYWLNDKREGSGSFFYAASGKVFVGEWSDDQPRAGVYTQAHDNPEQAAPVPVTTTLPRVRLAQPAEVLEEALLAVRKARKTYRAKNTPVGRLFDDDEIVALRAAFEGVQRADGTISPSDLAEVCSQLGTELSTPRLHHLLTDAGVTGPLESASVTVDDFFRVVALLLEEEAANNPELSQGDQHLDLGDDGDLWDESEQSEY